MNSIRKILDKILEVACILIFGIMTILVVYQVVTRYVFQSPSSWSESVVTYGFIWLAMLGGAYVFGKRDHMAMILYFLCNEYDLIKKLNQPETEGGKEME